MYNAALTCTSVQYRVRVHVYRNEIDDYDVELGFAARYADILVIVSIVKIMQMMP